MGTHFIFPKPKDWDTFEDIVCDVFARKYNNFNFQRYGRSGQSQSGVDIAGFTQVGMLGIQCKHHPDKNIPNSEIDDEITKAEEFEPTLDEFVIVTSADRDVTAHKHVLKISQQRQEESKFSVTIKFWQDIYGWLTEFPDLVYKHFTKYFPTQELENIHVSNLNQLPRKTITWPVTFADLTRNINETIHGIPKIEPYKPIIGVTTFPDVNFNGIADLEIQFAHLYTEEQKSEAGFAEAANILNQVRSMLRDPYFAQEVWFYPQVRLPLAFLLGWIFRRVSHFNLGLVFNNQIWITHGLPHVPSKLVDGLPHLGEPENKEAALILNISRKIESSVFEFIGSWKEKPKTTLVYDLDGHQIASAAHALSVAINISQKIKILIDKWGIRKIHLFGAMPVALAVLIGFHLNAICPITIYFLDKTRSQYQVGGTLTNNL